MNYVSTRGRAPKLPFDDVLLTGLARDGGLYLPNAWPAFSADDIRALDGLSYAEQASRIMAPFVDGSVTAGGLDTLSADAYAGFDHPDVAPMTEIGEAEYVMELFHGPTLAFKDYALQLLGRLFDTVLGAREERITVVGATSGDTGSAAIEACRDRDSVEIFILHPKGRVSDVQRRQMTTVPSANVHNIALEGSFDDCQNLVKAMFNDQAFRDRHNLSAVNSINWARIMAQIVYYFRAAVARGAPDRPVSFAVPTGNFGNVFAGYAAHRMGLPIHKLIVGSNRNDILTRFFETGVMRTSDVHPTLSPSMDIQISSNFERLLFETHDRDGGRVSGIMAGFGNTGAYKVGGPALDAMLGLFTGARYDDDETKATIRQVHGESGFLLDPHSAIGVAAGRALRDDPEIPVIALATAHPAKFPNAVKDATGVTPELPPHLADLFEREERCKVLPNDLGAVQGYVTDRLSERGAA